VQNNKNIQKTGSVSHHNLNHGADQQKYSNILFHSAP